MNEAVSIGALAASIVDPWAWWRAALANPKEIGRSLPVHDGEPNTGFYRVRYAKDKPFEPVAIWKEDGQWLAYRSGKEVSAVDIWTNVCRHPVEYQAYNDAMEGKGWPDDDTVVAKQVQPPAPGDNSSKIDPAEELADQIESALKGKDAYAKITDDATAAKALSLRNRLNELSNQADKIREEAKAPHLAAGKAVDAKWQPLVKKAKAGADEVKASIGAWETEKLRRQREIERQQAEELRKQEEARRAAEAAGEAQEPNADVAVAEAPVAPSVPTSIQPTYGRAASVSVKLVVTEVTDYAALYAYMANRQEVQDLLRQLAQKAIDAGRTNIPGIVTEERAAVR
jgi:hypothetical protein